MSTTTQIAIITAGALLVILGIGWWLNRVIHQFLANWRLKLQTAEENAKIERREREQRLSDEAMASGERVAALKAGYKADAAAELRRAKEALFNDYDRLSQELRELSGDGSLDGRAPTSPHPVDLGRHDRRSGNGAAPQPPAYTPAPSSTPDDPVTPDDPAPAYPPSTGRHAAKEDTSADSASKSKASGNDAEQVEPEPAIMAQSAPES